MIKIKLMKKGVVYLMALLLVMSVYSCQKEESEEAAGAIAGMGETSGELVVSPYELPDGIEIQGDINGVDVNEDNEVAAFAENKSLLKSWNFGNSYPDYGNGGQWIKVRITVSNSHHSPRTIFFPKGLVFKVNHEGYQHGILLQWTWFVVNPGSSRTILLNLYCLNKGRNGSSSDAQYSIAGVTESRVMWKLLNRIGWRKINCEHYFPNNSNLKSTNGLKGDEDLVEHYEDISNLLQDAVWSITNGDGLTAQQIQEIEALPELEPGTYPEELENGVENAPFNFDEYTPPAED